MMYLPVDLKDTNLERPSFVKRLYPILNIVVSALKMRDNVVGTIFALDLIALPQKMND